MIIKTSVYLWTLRGQLRVAINWWNARFQCHTYVRENFNHLHNKDVEALRPHPIFLNSQVKQNRKMEIFFRVKAEQKTFSVNVTYLILPTWFPFHLYHECHKKYLFDICYNCRKNCLLGSCYMCRKNCLFDSCYKCRENCLFNSYHNCRKSCLFENCFKCLAKTVYSTVVASVAKPVYSTVNHNCCKNCLFDSCYNCRKNCLFDSC